MKQVYSEHDLHREAQKAQPEIYELPQIQSLIWRAPLTIETAIYFIRKVMELYDSMNKETKKNRRKNLEVFMKR